MADGLLIPQKETFKDYSVDSKLDTLFDITIAIHEQSCLVHEKCDERFEKLENRRWLDKGLASISGLVGGAAAAIGLKISSGS